MKQENISQKITLHKSFWERKPLKRPLVSFQLDEYFVSKRISAMSHLLKDGEKITPQMLDVDRCLSDYEKMYNRACSTGQDGFWTAEPYNGIPWMEAILGCEIYGTKDSFISHPYLKSAQDLTKIEFNPDNAWLKKYFEFITKLEKFSNGRFPIGQPIMRGASDMIGALIGQIPLIFEVMEEPEIIKNVFLKVMNIFSEVIKLQYDLISKFYNGYSLGFYHVWCPGKCIWFQEDLSALLSPQIYNDFLLKPDTAVCKGYDYTAVHLHPSSFFILDSLLKIDELKAIQVNKDLGGPSVKDMMPNFQKIITKKNLIIFGDIDEVDIDCILNELPQTGVFLNIFAPTVERAKQLMEYIEFKS